MRAPNLQEQKHAGECDDRIACTTSTNNGAESRYDKGNTLYDSLFLCPDDQQHRWQDRKPQRTWLGGHHLVDTGTPSKTISLIAGNSFDSVPGSPYVLHE